MDLTDVYVHPTAILDGENVGPGSRIWAFTHVMKGAVIGKYCNLGEHCFVEDGAYIDDYVTVKNGNCIWEGVKLEQGVFVGPGVLFTNDRYPRSPRLAQAEFRYADRDWLSLTVVKQGASLGAGAIILAGITVGEFSLVGAGAVVTRDVPPNSVVIGNPARIVGVVCKCGRRIAPGEIECPMCGNDIGALSSRLELFVRAA